MTPVAPAVTVNGAGTYTVLAVCPAGKIVIGGGYEYTTTPNGQVLPSSFPLSADTWRASFRVAQISPVSITARAYAVCVTQ